MGFFAIVPPILIISFLILIGFIVSRTYEFNGHTRQLFITLIVNTGMPALILSSIFKVDIDQAMFRKLIFVLFISITIGVIGIFIGLLASYFIHDSNRMETAILSGLGNTGFIGIPLCAVLFGPEGALYAAIFDAGTDLVLWSFGVTLLNSKNGFTFKTLKEIINIPFMAIILGLVLASIGFKPPFFIAETFDYLAAFVIPLAMFYIGGLIGTIKRGEISRTKEFMWLPITLKLFVLPFVAVLVITIFKIDGMLAHLVVIQSMMPALTLSSILFSMYGKDEEYGAIVTITTTILAMPAIPLMYALMTSLFTIG